MTRIAMVGHGDYAAAIRVIGRGEPEPYFGMAYTLQALAELFGEAPHLVISLDAPRYREFHGAGELVGLPMPRLPRPIPGTLAMALWAHRIVRELERFRPTHVLLRTSGIVAWNVLRYTNSHRLSTLVTFASTFDDPDPKNRFVNRQLARRLNHPGVFLVGNHKGPATDSMIEMGVDPRKAVAYDWPGARRPDGYPIKMLTPGMPWRLLFVGSVSRAKGVLDLVDAVRILHDRGRPVRLTVVGGGPELSAVRERARALPDGHVVVPGRVGNDEAFRLMVASTLVCFPSRPEFPEGMPMTLTEALASRTPVIASDHPVLKRAFVDGEGLRFFRARDPLSLANTIEDVLDDPESYSRLSVTTAAAFARVECPTALGDLFRSWKRGFQAGGETAPTIEPS